MNSKEFDSFLLNNSGVTGQANKAIKKKIYDEFENPFRSSIFFKPWQSKSDPFYKTLSIITAPVCLSILTLKLTLESVFLAFKSIVDLAQSGSKEAKTTFKRSMKCLLGMIIALVSAIVSPLVNIVDLIGSGVSTIAHECTNEGSHFDLSF